MPGCCPVGHGLQPSSREQPATRRDHPATEAFRARRLREREVAAADLVLTMTGRHRARVLEDMPSALRRVFTLEEFARLLEVADPPGLPFPSDPSDPSDPAERARDLVPAVLAVRGTVRPVDAALDAVPDPIDGDLDAHAVAAREIDAAVRHILDVVAPCRPVPPPRVTRPPSSPGPAAGPASHSAARRAPYWAAGPEPHPSGPLVALDVQEPAPVGGA